MSHCEQIKKLLFTGVNEKNLLETSIILSAFIKCQKTRVKKIIRD